MFLNLIYINSNMRYQGYSIRRTINVCIQHVIYNKPTLTRQGTFLPLQFITLKYYWQCISWKNNVALMLVIQISAKIVSYFAFILPGTRYFLTLVIFDRWWWSLCTLMSIINISVCFRSNIIHNVGYANL